MRAYPTCRTRFPSSISGTPCAWSERTPENRIWHRNISGTWASGRGRISGFDFLAVEGYPAKKRPFYTYPQPADPYWTNLFDLIFRGVELVTGGQRGTRVLRL